MSRPPICCVNSRLVPKWVRSLNATFFLLAYFVYISVTAHLLFIFICLSLRTSSVKKDRTSLRARKLLNFARFFTCKICGSIVILLAMKVITQEGTHWLLQPQPVILQPLLQHHHQAPPKLPTSLPQPLQAHFHVPLAAMLQLTQSSSQRSSSPA